MTGRCGLLIACIWRSGRMCGGGFTSIRGFSSVLNQKHARRSAAATARRISGSDERSDRGWIQKTQEHFTGLVVGHDVAKDFDKRGKISRAHALGNGLKRRIQKSW